MQVLTQAEKLAPHIFRQRLLIEGFYSCSLDETTVSEFLDGLAVTLRLGTYCAPFVSSSRGFGSDVNQGFEAFLPLIESGISLYTWSRDRFFSIVLFTCKAFDETEAVRTIRQRLGADKMVHYSF
jgi:S-adenosylmethionine/arginine decarboxylase-like enzyme